MNQIMLNLDNIEKKGLAAMRGRSRDIVSQCGRVAVRNEMQFAAVGDLVKIQRNEVKRMNELRRAAIKEQQDYVKLVNAKFKELSAPMKEAISAATKKATDWASKEERYRRKNEKKAVEKSKRQAIMQAKASLRAAARAKKKAASLEKKSRAAKDPAKSEQLLQQAELLSDQADEHKAASSEMKLAAARADKVDMTIRNVRGSLGTTSGIRKTLTFDLQTMDRLPRVFRDAILKNKRATNAIRAALKKDPKAAEYIDKLLRPGDVKKLESVGHIAKSGLIFSYDQKLSVR